MERHPLAASLFTRNGVHIWQTQSCLQITQKKKRRRRDTDKRNPNKDGENSEDKEKG